ncbi:hypothetical protein D3C76_1024490 [compost metagenome]
MAELNVKKVNLFAEQDQVRTNLYNAAGNFRSCIVRDKTVIRALHTALVTTVYNDVYQIIATTDETVSPHVLTEIRIDNQP